MSDLLIRHGEVADVLNGQFGRGFAEDVADIIKKDGVKTVQHAVVSSQFDADRLDYMRRDRMMAGTQHAAIDFPWLIANLEIGAVETGVDDTPTGKIETFVLGPKAIHAAEAFVLGLFQLYPTVYFHKTTRGVEQIFTELLVRFVELVRQGHIAATGISANHPLTKFALDPENIDVALGLDDTVVWGALTLMSDASDPVLSSFSTRLRDRKLLRCFDIRTVVAHQLDPKSINSDELIAEIDACCAKIENRLKEWAEERNRPKSDDSIRPPPSILVDSDKRSPYKPVNESKGPLDRINIRTEGSTLVDLKERSSVVAALKTFKLSRAYADREDPTALDFIDKTVNEEIETCRTKAQ